MSYTTPEILKTSDNFGRSMHRQCDRLKKERTTGQSKKTEVEKSASKPAASQSKHHPGTFSQNLVLFQLSV